MELGPFGTQELALAAGALLLIVLIIVLLVARSGRGDEEEVGEPGITSASRDELIERAIRAEAERDIFRATVKHLREENERLRRGVAPETEPHDEVRADVEPADETADDEDEAWAEDLEHG